MRCRSSQKTSAIIALSIISTFFRIPIRFLRANRNLVESSHDISALAFSLRHEAPRFRNEIANRFASERRRCVLFMHQ